MHVRALGGSVLCFFSNHARFAYNSVPIAPGSPLLDIEWKLIYVGSAENESYDQELDTCMVGPVPIGVNSFEFEVSLTHQLLRHCGFARESHKLDALCLCLPVSIPSLIISHYYVHALQCVGCCPIPIPNTYY